MAVIAFLAGGLAAAALTDSPLPRWAALVAPIAGMGIAARIDPYTRNAVVLPRLLLALAFVCAALRWSTPWQTYAGVAAVVVLGALASALPASIVRGAGEMERPVVSSLVWSMLSLGGGLALAFVPW